MAPLRLSIPRLLITSCGDIASMSATSSAGVTCRSAPTAVVYGIFPSRMISACSSELSALASRLSTASGLSSGGVPSNRLACALSPGLIRSVAYRCLRCLRALSAAPSNCRGLRSRVPR